MNSVGLPIVGHRIETKDLERERAIAEAEGDKQEPLFCILTREFNPKGRLPQGGHGPIWELKHIYRHAPTENAAKIAYLQSVCDAFGNPLIPFDVVGVARPIGCIAQDDHGDVCKL